MFLRVFLCEKAPAAELGGVRATSGEGDGHSDQRCGRPIRFKASALSVNTSTTSRSKTLSATDTTSQRRRKVGSVDLRSPDSRDGAKLWDLVKRSGVLEENSCYAYLLLSTHFASSSVVAELNGRVVGFVAAYFLPARPDVIFVWQIGVDSDYRRSGLGKRLLRHLVSLPRARNARFLEATVAPSNRPSRRLFESFAAELGVDCCDMEGFSPEDFGGTHEEERLLRIGPLHEKEPVTDEDV